MTLDISKFIANSIRTQSKIHHLDINVKAVKKAGIPKSVSSLIENDYGEKYLDDADYVAFFWGGIGKEQIDKLFNVVDKALGKSANKLTDKDFKKISIRSSSELKDDSKDDEEEQEVEDTEEVEVEDDDNEESPDVDDEDKELNEDDDEEIEVEDDEEANDGKDVEEIEMKEEKIPLAYFFLKITAK